MKYISKLIILSAILLFSSNLLGSVVFQDSSPLKDGKWVKIEISRTGLYHISNQELAEMGFNNPERVGVYGKGGEMFSLLYDESADGMQYEDGLRPVAVVHDKDGLIFYGEGVEKILWNNDDETFNRRSKNIYTDTAIYFLSDNTEPLKATSIACADSDSSHKNNAFGFLFHEKDLCHNVTKTGQAFWGEDFEKNNGKLEWSLPVSNAASGTAILEYAFYIEPNAREKITYNYGSEIIGSPEKYYGTDTSVQSSQYKPKNKKHTFTVIPTDEYNITLRAECEKSDFVLLDYWLLTYPKSLPSNAEEIAGQQYFAIPGEGGSDSETTVAIPYGINAIDVTDTQNIRILECSTNESYHNYTFSGGFSELVFYRDERDLYSINGWTEVANSNIHGETDPNCELLIISVPTMMDCAQQIADLHREYDKIPVCVVSTENMYNEFSGGMPDPMAYRSLAKMLYQRGNGKLKNVLLLGPSQADFRSFTNSETMADRHIAFQELKPTLDRDAATLYDFYGYVSDEFRIDQLYKNKMDIGVGIISCNNITECRRIVRKIKRFLEDEKNTAWFLNETLNIGGVGDKHTHDWQAVKYSKLLENNADGALAATTLSIDAFGNNEARKRFILELDKGNVLTTYFGHGGPTMMGKDRNFFTASNASMLKNSKLGFYFFGGCHFTRPEFRERGLGESILLDTDNGMIGGVVSTRSTLSTQNYILASIFAESWLNDCNRGSFPTIGEVYANSKSKSSNSNSMSYMLAGDPALRIPTASENVIIETTESIVPGTVSKISGYISNPDNEQDKSFCGKVVLKLMKPECTLASQDYISQTCSATSADDRDTLLIPINTDRLLCLEADVKNGHFETEFMIPYELSAFNGMNARLFTGAYDHNRKIGAVGTVSLPISNNQDFSLNEHIKDIEAPLSTIVFDEGEQLLNIRVTDNYALHADASGISLKLDDDKIQECFCEAHPYAACKELSVNIDASSILPGKHTLELKCSDISGNKSSELLEFEIPSKLPSLELNLDSKILLDKITVSISGSDSEQLELDMRDQEGKMIMRKSIQGKEFELQSIDNDGNTLAPGMYKIRVREGYGKGHKYSEWLNIVVLE